MNALRPEFALLLATLTICAAGNANAQLQAPPIPPENPATEQKRILGKILFWDEQLSSDDTVACGTCHIPAAGGSDPRPGRHPGPDGVFSTDDDTIGSPGIIARDPQNQPVVHPLFGEGLQVTGRASPGIFMSMYSGDMFWDGRARSAFRDPLNPGTTVVAAGGGLESQAVGPILSDVEMAHRNRGWTDVINKLTTVDPLALAARLPADVAAALSGNPSYPDLFSAAFGDPAITPVRIALAIASYERTLVPDQTPWDRFMRGEQDAMTARQIAGWNSFRDDTVCDNCHVAPHFTDHDFYNIGLRPADEDGGRQNVTLDANDFGSFKTPSLRNVGLRTALTHVGWVADTADALAFYNASALINAHRQFTSFQSVVPTPEGGPTVPYALVTVFPGDDLAQAPIIDFLRNALTDPRAANESFPFDRPLLISEQLVLLSYDLSGAPWTAARADLVAGVIAAQDADVVALQETTPDMLDDLLTRLGDYDAAGPAGETSTEPMLIRRGKLNATMSGSSSAALACGGYEHIDHVVLESATSGETISLFNNTLCPPNTAFPAAEPTAAQRNDAAAVLLAETMLESMADQGVPALATGNFNADELSGAMRFLTAGSAVTYADTNPLQLTDALRDLRPAMAGLADTQWSLITGADSGITLLDATVVDDPAVATAADLPPLLITLAIDTTPANIEARPGNPDDIAAPSVPDSFLVSQASESSIGLTWNVASDDTGVARYRLYRNGGLLATTTTPGYTDRDVTAPATYTYGLAAIDAAGNESGLVVLRATAEAPAPTPAPGGSSGGGALSPAVILALFLAVRRRRTGTRIARYPLQRPFR
jgi:cytochrome c peroxidase